MSLAALATGGCIEADDQGTNGLDEVATSETTQSLSVLNWTATSTIGNGMWYPQVGNIAGRILVLHSGPSHELFWRERDGVNAWSAPVAIPGTQVALNKPSVAAFNGYLYMIYTAYGTSTSLRVTRFNPATSTWSPIFSIPHTSYGGPPALAAYNGVLQMIGVDPATKKLWRATMSTSETFSVAVPMEGHYSNSRVSAAVQGCKLHIVHRAGSGTTIVHNFFDAGGWTYDRTIPAGPGGAAIQAYEPVIAERAGYLHLLRRDTSSAAANVPVWWTYYNGSSWPSEVSVGTATTYYSPSLTSGGSGLVAVDTLYYNSPGVSMEYVQSLPPFQPLPCLAPPVFE